MGPITRTAGILAVLGMAIGPSARAQLAAPQRGPGPNALQILVVPAFASSDKALGCSAANEVRDRLDGDVDTKKLWVIAQHSEDETLKASGFPPCTPVSTTDDKQLAVQLRGDAYLDGTVTKTATGVRIDSKIVLARDASAVQPLPPAEGKSVGDAAKIVSKEVIAAMKQYDGEEKCFNSARSGNYPAAIAAAREAMAAYPQAALARLCIVNTIVAMKAPPDSVIAVTGDILKDDPHNQRALELSAQAYYEKKDYDNAVKAWGGLIASDPSNTARVEDVVTKIVQSGHADAAIPIVQQAIKDNPDDPKLQTLSCRLLLAAKHNKEAPPVCEAAIKADTAFADTLYFQRITTAYLADSQPQKAAQSAETGLKKFANNITLMQLAAQAYLASGQTQQAVADIEKVLQSSPKQPAMWELLYTADLMLNQPDSALAALHGAVANGDAPGGVASFALTRANTYFKSGNASKNNDTLELAIKWAKYSDTLAASAPAKFIAGAAEFQIGLAADQEGAKAKNCDQVTKAQQYWNNATTDLHGGGSTAPQAAGQMLQLINQYLPSIDKQVKAYCKK